jgi:hypothetical protein
MPPYTNGAKAHEMTVSQLKPSPVQRGLDFPEPVEVVLSKISEQDFGRQDIETS